ncbi:MAG: hypothetical protein BGO21_29565 [Dyadobacter sp. 50-39]|uniref:hypothetical protein n=1 Tax=Dyadobacter sp. 50-39 TaxID=1895756 RepID=UPI00095B6568|nr:hypothetical protein [Dyadobacter sp. 50-39]OJV16989.1 MAG: hypothetical protein BGO21_29565 [Dyadobacter sp. 50-39]
MPNHITIYLTQNLTQLSVEEINSGISAADWWTLGEKFDIEEDAVDDFWDTLKWSDSPISFYQEGVRPVQISLYNEEKRLKEEIEETLQRNLPNSVRKHMESVTSVVILELGISQSNTLFEIVAFEIAYWLADTKHGLILSPDGLWFDHCDNRWQPIV